MTTASTPERLIEADGTGLQIISSDVTDGTTTRPGMWTDPACKALREKKILELRYDGYSRSVEVHAVGYSKTGEALMRAWQLRGGSTRGERTGWKLMRLAEASGADISDEPSAAPRAGYRRGDPAMTRIISEI